jgi:hypothetical protein
MPIQHVLLNWQLEIGTLLFVRYLLINGFTYTR